ncbi:MAG: hypothetical protein M9924_21915 [Rhizobiaceae bacterium]|nr:hypothetical protein [Rhizobiaceae bacterium]
MLNNGRSADPPSAIGFFGRLFGFLFSAGLFIRAVYWILPTRETLLEPVRLLWLGIGGPLLLLAIYPVAILAYDTLLHFVPKPLRRVRTWKEQTRRQAEANAALAAFTSIGFTIVVLLLRWLIPRVEDPIGQTLLFWSYRLTLASLALSAGAALLGFYVARQRFYQR